MKILLNRFLLFASALVLAAGLSACGGNDDNSGRLNFLPPAQNPNPALLIEISGSGLVQSQPAAVNCTTNCKADLEPGTVLTLTATPAVGQVFSTWGGACSGAALSCVMTMDQSRSVSASFAPPSGQATYSLRLAVNGSGTVSSQPAGISCPGSCSSDYAADTLVTLTAVAGANQSFAGWTGACSASAGTCTVPMNQVRSVGADFAPVVGTNFSLNVSTSGGGSVVSSPAGINCGSACQTSVPAGAAITLLATPAAGQVFSGWSGACTGNQPSCSLQMTQVRSTQAIFTVVPAIAWGPATLLETNNDFNVGNSVLTATSPNGNAFVIWEQSDGVPTGTTVKVFSRRYVAGIGWDAAVVVPGVSTSSSSVRLVGGKLLMDAAGIATWLRPNLETRRFTPVSGWSAPFVPPVLAAGLLSDAVMDPTGAISVVTAGSNVYNITLAANAGSWQPWTRVDVSGTLSAQNASVAISANGTAMAIWRESNPGDALFSIKAARFEKGVWLAPQTIDNSFDNVSKESQSRIAMDAAGNAVAVWHQGNSLYYNVFSAASGWGSAVQVDANAVESSFSARISLRMTESGRAVVIWNSGIFAVKSMQYTPSSGFSAPTTVNGYGIDNQLGLDADGNATLVYVAPDKWPNPTTGSDLYSRRLPWGGTWSAAVAIEPLDGLGFTTTDASFNSVGQGVASWVRGDVSGSTARKSLWVSVLR